MKMEKTVNILNIGLEGPSAEHGSIVKYVYRKMHYTSIQVDIAEDRKRFGHV